MQHSGPRERTWYLAAYIYSFALFYNDKMIPESLHQEHCQQIYYIKVEICFPSFHSFRPSNVFYALFRICEVGSSA